MLRADLETQFALASHRLNVYQRRLYDDPWRLLNPLWRRDIAQAQREVTTLLFDRLRIGQSLEAIVEKVLSGCIDERSPCFDAARRAEGRHYGEVAGADLSAKDQEAFAATLRGVRQELARVRAEIESLKRFYSR